jgi:16S rRNA (uracil1498-N3)-methyltransferase
MNRFYVDKGDIHGGRVRITGEDVRHITRVLRLKTGDPVTVCDGHNTDYDGVIEKLGKGEVKVKLGGAVPTGTEADIGITLYQAVAKGTKMEFIIQKGTELGIVRFVPVITSRTIVRLDNDRDAKKKVDRWQRIAVEAAKQSCRGRIPAVEPPTDFASAARDMQKNHLALLPHADEREKPIASIPGKKGDYESIGIMIGPEGGFDRDEVEMAQRYGIHIISMGPRILRTETAGIVMTAVLMYRFGDLGGL